MTRRTNIGFPGRFWNLSALPCILAVSMLVAQAAAAAEDRKVVGGKVDFNRDIRPILSENCYKCHGPDNEARKAKLRFDIRAEALKPAKSGTVAIVPGAPDKSEIIARVTAPDPDDRMPPLKTGKKLNDIQVELLKRWVAQGAPYATHWAYVKPMRPALPEVKNKRWTRNAIDSFILARLEREHLSPAVEANPYFLIRRVSLDLTGLPPTIEEVDQFVNDHDPRAYEKLVDRLLQKPTFGEHWARMWLDLARYADSAGYADDPARTIWAYRDYVIRAFNANKHFDRFTIEQIAGDLLDDADEEDKIASAFHRNTMTNSEGGTTDEEFRNAAIVDRVNTTMAVWMATSMGCAQCHTHKYDPITQHEYFQFFAFFNNTEDADRPDEAPVLEFFTDYQKSKRKKLDADITRLEQFFRMPTPESIAEEAKWEKSFPLDLRWMAMRPETTKSKSDAQISVLDDDSVLVMAASEKVNDVTTLVLPVAGERITGLRLEALPHEKLPHQGPGHGANGGFVVSRISATLVPPKTEPTTGRYVRIEIPGKEKTLSLAEVQVFSGSENLALKGAASQSSTAYDGLPRRAIDGTTDGDYEKAKSTTHTEKSDNPWWEVDLKSAQSISRIVVWNRTDSELESRLSDFRVALLDDNREPVWSTMVKDPPKPSQEFSVDDSRSIVFAFAQADTAEAGFDAAKVIEPKSDKKSGWSPGPGEGKAHQLVLQTEKSLSVMPGFKLQVVIEQVSERKENTLGHFRLGTTDDARVAQYAGTPATILNLLKVAVGNRTPQEQASLIEYYRGQIAPEFKAEREKIGDLKKQLAEVKPYTVPVMHELPGDKRRKTHLQLRGNYLALGDEVTEAVAAAFHPLEKDRPPDRLALANWLVDTNNPLTARVMANRFWEQIFGVGIVRTVEDFGSQGDLPTHPELLDWLATEFMAQNWDAKSFLKMLVTSAAYRQSSRVTPELQERDPDNVLLARGPRFRMPAEVVRDQALAVSGLLSGKMYGPSVRPPQPSSGLTAAFGSSLDWKTSEGEDRYRRALYVEWRRTSPYPSMATFDAPNREVCSLRRPRSNTPLQALVTLNDPVYVEAAQALGRRMAASPGCTSDKIRYGFRACLARAPHEQELQQLISLYESSRSEYDKEPDKSIEIATEPLGKLPEGTKPAEGAAWTIVGNVLLNLDELLMKP